MLMYFFFWIGKGFLCIIMLLGREWQRGLVDGYKVGQIVGYTKHYE